MTRSAAAPLLAPVVGTRDGAPDLDHRSPLPARPRVSVVVAPGGELPGPPDEELAGLPDLLERLESLRLATGLPLDLVLVGDGAEGSAAIERQAQAFGGGAPPDWVRVLAGPGVHGEAVIAGLRAATGEVLVVMEADLRHPPEAIPALVQALRGGAEAAVGSRFVDGATSVAFGPVRRLGRRAASLLARPLASVKDPSSGFVALRRATFEQGRDFRPVGRALGLELLLKCGCQRVAEVPIHFDGRRRRRRGRLQEKLRYLRQLRRLYVHKYGTWSHLVLFMAVGFSGLLVNLAALTVLLGAHLGRSAAVALAIAASMLWNFALNRWVTFSYARGGSLLKQLVGFVAACSVGAAVNFAVTEWLWELVAIKQLAAVAGVVAGTAFNFVASRFAVFRERQGP